MPNYGLPSPRTWQDNQPIPAPWLRQDAGGGAAFLNGPPVFSGIQFGNPQVIAVSDASGASPVDISVEQYDPWNVHRLTGSGVHLARCYPQLPGYYLCQAFTPLVGVSSGATGACIRAVQAGSGPADFPGQTCVNNATHPAGPIACKLVRISQVSGYGSGDYAGPSMYQISDGSQPVQITASMFPRFDMRWVGALSGSQPLPPPLPANVPAPPRYVDATWLNANIRDVVNGLIYPPLGEWYDNTSVMLPSQTGLPDVGYTLPMNHAPADTYGAWNAGTSTWTAPWPGTYFVYLCLVMADFVTVQTRSMAVGPTVRSANYAGGSPVTLWCGAQAAAPVAFVFAAAVFRRRLRLNAGDTIQPAGFQDDARGTGFAGLAPVNVTMTIAWRGL